MIPSERLSRVFELGFTPAAVVRLGDQHQLWFRTPGGPYPTVAARGAAVRLGDLFAGDIPWGGFGALTGWSKGQEAILETAAARTDAKVETILLSLSLEWTTRDYVGAPLPSQEELLLAEGARIARELLPGDPHHLVPEARRALLLEYARFRLTYEGPPAPAGDPAAQLEAAAKLREFARISHDLAHLVGSPSPPQTVTEADSAARQVAHWHPAEFDRGSIEQRDLVRPIPPSPAFDPSGSQLETSVAAYRYYLERLDRSVGALRAQMRSLVEGAAPAGAHLPPAGWEPALAHLDELRRQSHDTYRRLKDLELQQVARDRYLVEQVLLRDFPPAEALLGRYLDLARREAQFSSAATGNERLDAVQLSEASRSYSEAASTFVERHRRALRALRLGRRSARGSRACGRYRARPRAPAGGPDRSAPPARTDPARARARGRYRYLDGRRGISPLRPSRHALPRRSGRWSRGARPARPARRSRSRAPGRPGR